MYVLVIERGIILHQGFIKIAWREVGMQVVVRVYVYEITQEVEAELFHGNGDHLVFGAPYRTVYRHMDLPDLQGVHDLQLVIACKQQVNAVDTPVVVCNKYRS